MIDSTEMRNGFPRRAIAVIGDHQWIVLALRSGGWVNIASFMNEADAWEYGYHLHDAIVYERVGQHYEARGMKRDFGRCWQAYEESKENPRMPNES